jgi:lysophospholipase L1-like esterase
MKSLSRFAVVVVAGLLTLGAPAQTNQTPAGAAVRFAVPDSDDGLPGAGPIRREPWFRKFWNDRRSMWADHVQQDQNAIVFLGDSITQGWGEDLGGSFGALKVANRGISGDTTRGVLIRMDEDVLGVKPKAVVLLIGTNDIELNSDPDTIMANLKLIIAKLKAHNPKMPIILCLLTPSSPTRNRPTDKVKQVNQLYMAAVKGDAQITLLETYRLFANPQGEAKSDEFPDLLHPNKAGYAKWFAALRPIFATLGFMETEPDTFTVEPGFVSLFNGRDLTGWGFKTNNFDGQTISSDGRYVALNGRLIVSTPPEYRKVEAIWTTRQFPKDFVLKLEFRATPYADSGVFIREPQLQCRDYLIAGPYTKLEKYKPQDWNEMVVTVKGGEAYCTCNGEVLEAAMKVPATGPVGLEGDRGQMEYRRIRVQELP